MNGGEPPKNPGVKETLAYGARARDTRVDDTMAAPAAATAARTLVQGGVRATVLPRIEHIEGTRRVVLSGRPRYEELEHLGSGGQAQVVLTRDHDIDRRVAVKRLRPEVRDEGALLRFAEEVRAVGQMEHPNVVPIHDVGVDHDGNYFYVMKHVEGETLETIISELRAERPEYVARYTAEYRAQICYEVLRGVEHAHSLGILHRDLKPANIMVGKLGEVLVMDWGLAKNVTAPELPAPAPAAAPRDSGGRARLFETQNGALLGTPAYMAPEQAAGRLDALDARSDVYSLAVTFYEFLTLLHPRRQHETLAGMLAAAVSEPIGKAQILTDFARAGTPAPLAHFVRHGLGHDPGERYPSVAAMRQRLELVRDGHAPIECQITFVQRGLRGLSHGIDRHPVGVTAAMATFALAFLGSVGALVWLLVR